MSSPAELAELRERWLRSMSFPAWQSSLDSRILNRAWLFEDTVAALLFAGGDIVELYHRRVRDGDIAWPFRPWQAFDP